MHGPMKHSMDGFTDDLDEVEQRHHEERRPRGRLAHLRRRGLAIALVSGAIVSSGGTAVLAATSLTGGSTTSFFPSTSSPPSSGVCQYHPSWTRSFTFKKDKDTTITVTISF